MIIVGLSLILYSHTLFLSYCFSKQSDSESVFSPVDLEQLNQCFNEFDVEESGLIYCKDLYDLVISTGVEGCSQEVVNEVISSLEADALTQISFPEFLDVLAVLTSA